MNCPNCQSDVKVTEQNYGSLFTCPSCQAAYFINFEGQAEFGAMDEPMAPPESLAPDYNIAPITFAEASDPLIEPAPINPLGPSEVIPTLSEFELAAQDISSFGNAETQGAILNYDLTISGLDTVEILKEFKEAIDDPRFGWETNSMMKSIRNGEVGLLRLNPVKAYILSKRLQFLDVEKIWKQNVLS